MPQSVIPATTLKKFSRLADLLEKASQVAREITYEATPDEDFWKECEHMQAAFSDLRESQINTLVGRAVKAVRRQQKTLQA